MKSIESQANENKQSLNHWREMVESVAAFATSGGVNPGTPCWFSENKNKMTVQKGDGFKI